jgi:uncharacterized membrane protein YphA (DoxX/SURF4 family)
LGVFRFFRERITVSVVPTAVSAGATPRAGRFGVPGGSRRRNASRVDVGLLLLRGAGLFLFGTYGWQKATGYLRLLGSGAPLAVSGLTPLIRSVGFPAPALLGVFVVLCESLGALLVAVGLATRTASACLALSMAGAFYTSMRLGEEPIRALLYCAIFLALAFAGPGALSLDAARASTRGAVPKTEAGRAEAGAGEGTALGLLILRAGTAFSTVLVVLPPNAVPPIFGGQESGFLLGALLLASALAGSGLFARQSAATVAVFWSWLVCRGMRAGQPFYSIPTRDALFAIAYMCVAVAGGGRFSIDEWRRRRRSRGRGRGSL